MKFIYWFSYFNLSSPSVRYRAFYPLHFFKQKNIMSYLVTPSYSFKGIIWFVYVYFSALFFRKKDSIIVIQRVRSKFIYAQLLKLLVKVRNHNTIFDIDDADYLEYPPETTNFFFQNCHKISSGSNEISNYAKHFNKNVWHTTSPTMDLQITKTKRNNIFTIGWIGGYSWGHKKSLKTLLFPAIKLLKFNVKLIILGVTEKQDISDIHNTFKHNKNVKIEVPEFINWLNEFEIQQWIIKFDIGIATLLNNNIQISKSGIKAKQYMNNGIPVLCNNLPENNNYVINGYNGYYCNSVDEFKYRINEFGNMNDERYWTFSNNARNSIKHFNHQHYYECFYALSNY